MSEDFLTKKSKFTKNEDSLKNLFFGGVFLVFGLKIILNKFLPGLILIFLASITISQLTNVYKKKWAIDFFKKKKSMLIFFGLMVFFILYSSSYWSEAHEFEIKQETQEKELIAGFGKELSQLVMAHKEAALSVLKFSTIDFNSLEKGYYLASIKDIINNWEKAERELNDLNILLKEFKKDKQSTKEEEKSESYRVWENVRVRRATLPKFESLNRLNFHFQETFDRNKNAFSQLYSEAEVNWEKDLEKIKSLQEGLISDISNFSKVNLYISGLKIEFSNKESELKINRSEIREVEMLDVLENGERLFWEARIRGVALAIDISENRSIVTLGGGNNLVKYRRGEEFIGDSGSLMLVTQFSGVSPFEEVEMWDKFDLRNNFLLIENLTSIGSNMDISIAKNKLFVKESENLNLSF